MSEGYSWSHPPSSVQWEAGVVHCHMLNEVWRLNPNSHIPTSASMTKSSLSLFLFQKGHVCSRYKEGIRQWTWVYISVLFCVYIYTHTKKIYSPQILVILCHTHVITFSCYQCTLAKLLQSCLTLCQYTKLNWLFPCLNLLLTGLK